MSPPDEAGIRSLRVRERTVILGALSDKHGLSGQTELLWNRPCQHLFQSTTLPAEVAIAIGIANQYLLGNMSLTRDQVLRLVGTLASFNGGGSGPFKSCGDDEH